jgi:CheY-like chemotaxis protein
MSVFEIVEREPGRSEEASENMVPMFPPRARVLIVDDIAENRMLLAMFCEQFGIAHECAEGGHEAVAAASSGRFDAILMDIFMPHMDGIAATRAIRALPGAVSAAPIIAVTTAAEPGQVRCYLDNGMTDVVPKPINATRLMQALSVALARAKRKPARRKPAMAARLTA